MNRLGAILALKHLVQLSLTVITVIALITALSQCELSGTSQVGLQDVWEYYNDPSSKDNLTISLQSGEGIFIYGKEYFNYGRPALDENTVNTDFGHVRGLYAERPDSAICGSQQTCICKCGNVNLTVLDGDQSKQYFGLDDDEEAPSVSEGQLQCLEATCRSHPAPLKPEIEASNSHGEVSGSYSSLFSRHTFYESFAILNDHSVTSPAGTINSYPFTVAGYTDQVNTNRQILNITSDGNTDTDTRQISLTI